MLQTLTTISKRVVKQLRESTGSEGPKTPPAAASPAGRAATGPGSARRPDPAARSATPEPARRAEPDPTRPHIRARHGDPRRPRTRRARARRRAGRRARPRRSRVPRACWTPPGARRSRSSTRRNGESPASLPRRGPPRRPWQVVEAGLAEIVGARAIAVPIVIADAVGHELRFRLTVSLEQLLDE